MENQIQGGLLGSVSAPQPQQQGGQGLLGSFSGGAPQAPAKPSAQGVQMAMSLAQNPTPQMVQQIIGQLHQSGSPEAAQFEQMLQGLGSNPAAIKQFADMMVQKLGGAQQ